MHSSCGVDSRPVEGGFRIAGGKKAADIYVDGEDQPGVVRAVKDLQTDIHRVTGCDAAIHHDEKSLDGPAILVGTIGKSDVIDRLIREKKIDVGDIEGKWESFLIDVADDRLVIAGSDRRGTIFGVYDLCEQIGVSPWHWWADVPVRPRKELHVKPGRYVQGPPAVKYRGIFLNDEQPALTNWVNEKYGGYNSRFYVHVFELLLRLKANYLWPAMWYSAFNEDDPRNPELAHAYGIVMGTSHHEAMLRAQQEWKRHGRGPWDYSKNAKVLYDFWDFGVNRNKDFESIITIGMRGDGDEPMSEESDIALLQRIIADQRKIIAQRVNKDATQAPQLWALYKEVLEYFEKGMRVPDDVTLLWCDDNWGNIRRLPTEEERARPGGAGIYYHFDYVGGPRSYKWINTTQIPKVWEQMNLALEYGADRIWIVNVGDLKPMELPTDFFLRMAWSPTKWTGIHEETVSKKAQGSPSLGFPRKQTLREYTVGFAAQQFGEEHAEDIADILAKYTKYNARRKHELLEPTTFCLVNYHEADRVLAEWKELLDKAERINAALPQQMRNAYFQLVLHPVKASAIVNEMLITAGKNRLYAGQGRAGANDLPAKVRELFHADAALTEEYHRIAGGKWNHMMDQTHLGYTFWNQPPRNVMPAVTEITPSPDAEMGVAYEGTEICPWPGMPWEAVLPEFDVFNRPKRYIDVFNRGAKPFEFRVEACEPWIVITPGSGKVEKEQRLWVNVDWSKAPAGESHGYVKIRRTDVDGGTIKIRINAHNPKSPGNDFRGFVEADGYVCMEADHYTNKVDVGEVRWEKIDDLGRTGSAMTIFPVTANSMTNFRGSPCLEYQMHLWRGGKVEVGAVVSPTLNFVPGRGLRYAVSFDDAEPVVVDVLSDNSLQAWEQSVRDSVRIIKSTHTLAQPGRHVLKFRMVDPAVVLQRLIVVTGQLRSCYLGPPESWRNDRD